MIIIMIQRKHLCLRTAPMMTKKRKRWTMVSSARKHRLVSGCSSKSWRYQLARVFMPFRYQQSAALTRACPDGYAQSVTARPQFLLTPLKRSLMLPSFEHAASQIQTILHSELNQPSHASNATLSWWRPCPGKKDLPAFHSTLQLSVTLQLSTIAGAFLCLTVWDKVLV